MLNDDMITAHDALGQLGIICQPTLVLYGEHHFCTPLPLSEEVARAVPGAELIVLGDAGELIELQREEAFSVFSLSAVTRGGFDNLGGRGGLPGVPARPNFFLRYRFRASTILNALSLEQPMKGLVSSWPVK